MTKDREENGALNKRMLAENNSLKARIMDQKKLKENVRVLKERLQVLDNNKQQHQTK